METKIFLFQIKWGRIIHILRFGRRSFHLVYGEHCADALSKLRSYYRGRYKLDLSPWDGVDISDLTIDSKAVKVYNPSEFEEFGWNEEKTTQGE